MQNLKFDVKRSVFVCFAILILFLNIGSGVAQEPEFQVESTNLQVYRDGLVRVAQTLAVNESVAAVTLPLLVSSVDNLIVLDENQTVLDYEIDGIDLTVFTLGTTSVLLQYDTYWLTRKDFDVWSLILDTSYNITVLLPEQSTVIYLSEMPASIDTEGDQITLSLFPSQWEISYVFPLVPPADFQVSNLQATPPNVAVGEEVTVSVKVTNVGGQSGSHSLTLVINQTIEDTRTVTLSEGESTTEEFKVTKQTPGTYNIEIDGLVSEFTVREMDPNGTPSDGEPSDSIPLGYIVVAVVAVASILLAALILLRKREPKVEKISKAHPQLTQEEKDVIQFLAENDGKAFEAEIRERFPDIPRTSLWRLVRRLESLEIVSVKKIGLENRVELKK
jgi:uncharacterized membrane protein